jgi:enamine deaminase RidA (YjgF/YER057c/UK114 family)
MRDTIAGTTNGEREMIDCVEARIRQLGIELPTVAKPAGSYLPFVVVDGLVFVSGQLPFDNGELRFAGRVLVELSIDDGRAAAWLCGLNLLSQVREACEGDLNRVRRVVRLGGFVQASPGFSAHPKVIDAASQLMVDVFGDAGRHARAAVGAASLPLGAAVELEGVFALR